MTHTITYVTSNPDKLKEFEAVAPDSFKFVSKALELSEIQSLDLHEIVTDKLKRAYEIIKAPVIVEDVSAELESLNGLPGPFIKFFEQKLRQDALLQLSDEGTNVRIVCCMGYYDGKTITIEEGDVHGTIVAATGDNGFGFDVVVQPDGFDKTMAEMTPGEKKMKSAIAEMQLQN